MLTLTKGKLGPTTSPVYIMCQGTVFCCIPPESIVDSYCLQVLNLRSCELDTVSGHLYGFHNLKVLHLGMLHCYVNHDSIR